MFIKITGKNETVEMLDEALEKLYEARGIISSLPTKIKIEVLESSNEDLKITTSQDK